jgi:Icc-related predicted phosphoesterase
VLEGVHIWGSPVTPWFFDWAFNQHRGAPISKYWKQIPPDTDLLITHGPPAGILDATGGGHHVGCEELLKSVKHIKPKVHVFGHIHEAYANVQQDGTTFINASVVDSNFHLLNAPILCDL